MLYKKICFVGLAVYATLSRTTSGSIYYAYANSDPTACSTATSNDHCIFLCDKQDWKNNFSCGNAGICDITCDAKQCLKGYTVNAANAAQLNVYGPSVQNCYLGTTFHLPHSGSANFSTTASSSDPYQQMIVNAGPNTQNIHIDCSGGDGKDECQSMTINAETAEYLYINADDSELDGAPLLINCPRDSASASSCYINAWNQGTLDGVEINTKYGMPHDLMVNVDDTKNFKAVTLTCSGIDPAVTVDEKDLMDPSKNGCWNTQSPTLSPSAPTPPTAPTTAYPTSPPATYYAYANDGDTACSGAAYNDRCVLICNKQDWKTDFDCGNVRVCDIICENKQCLKDYTVIASDAGQLNVVGADVDKCYSGTTFHLPSYGSANFSSSDSARDPYQLITVNAGLNTQNIYIDCSGGDGKDECQGMIVNAETAEFLYINADNSELDGSPMVINCPQHSDYNGEYEAPCYINAWNKATIDGVEINTEYGIPHDVWINVDDAKNFKALSLTCSAIDSNAIIGANDLFDSTNNVCWNTPTPTTVYPSVSPTKYPSKYPTIYPTIYPSVTPTLPTLNPSLHPTLTPTNYPTLQPSKSPTKAPSISPSIQTDYPSISPSRYPTKYPSIPPSEYPTEQPSIAPSIPTDNPSISPSKYPTEDPSISPSRYPTQQPVVSPSMPPTVNPSYQPSAIPTTSPTKTPISTNYPTKVPTRSPTNYPTAKPMQYLKITDPPMNHVTHKPSSMVIDTTEQVSNGNVSPAENMLSGSDATLIISIILMVVGTLFCLIGCFMYYQRLNQGRTVLHKFSQAVTENNAEGRTVRTVLSGSESDVVNVKMEGRDENKDDYDDIVNIKMKSHSKKVTQSDSEDVDILAGVNTLEDPNDLPVTQSYDSQDIDILAGVNTLQEPNVLPVLSQENQDGEPVAFTEQNIDMLIRSDPEVIGEDILPVDDEDYGDIMGHVTLGGNDNDTVQ